LAKYFKMISSDKVCVCVYLTAKARAYNTGPKHSLLGQMPPGGEAWATVSIYIDSSNTGK
jgi:hypothetical protein